MEQQDPASPTSVAEFANRIRHALKMAAQTIDQDDGSLERTAGETRNLPRWLVDQAFANSLKELFLARPSSPTAQMNLLIAAEQFVERSGRDRFGLESLRVADSIRLEVSIGRRETDSDLQVRAFTLGLSFALGHPNSLQVLLAEADLERRMPALWLDLARDYLGVKAFEAKAEEALLTGRMSPSDLLPRLRNIHLRQGAAAAQRLLDAACVALWKRDSKAAADEFISRASAISPVGWRFGLSPTDESPQNDLMPLALYYSQRIFEGAQDPIILYKSITRTFDAHLHSSGDKEDESNYSIRELIITSALRSRDCDSYRCIAIISAACSGREFSTEWWWADDRWRLDHIETEVGPAQLQGIYEKLKDDQKPQTPTARIQTWRLGRLATACGLGLVR